MKYCVSESQDMAKFHECQKEIVTRIEQEILETLLKHNSYKSELLFKLYDDIVETISLKLTVAYANFSPFIRYIRQWPALLISINYKL